MISRNDIEKNLFYRSLTNSERIGAGANVRTERCLITKTDTGITISLSQEEI